MNRRYRELEKKATDTRCTYEKLLKKVNRLEEYINVANEDKKNALYSVQLLEEELKVVEQNNDIENIKPIIECESILNEYGNNFLEDALKKVCIYKEIFETKNNLLNEMIPKCKQLKEEIEMDEASFKFQWNKNRKHVTESMAMSALNRSKKKHKEYNKLCKKLFELLADRDKAKEQAHKLDIKVNAYIELRKKHKSLVNTYCMSKNITDTEFDEHKGEVVIAMDKVIDGNKKLIGILNLIENHQKELDKILSKLSIAKDKMEEAEYQFKEYKGMVGAA